MSSKFSDQELLAKMWRNMDGVVGTNPIHQAMTHILLDLGSRSFLFRSTKHGLMVLQPKLHRDL